MEKKFNFAEIEVRNTVHAGAPARAEIRPQQRILIARRGGKVDFSRGKVVETTLSFGEVRVLTDAKERFAFPYREQSNLRVKTFR